MNTATQTDAFARGKPHGHGGGKVALKDIKPSDDSKYHAVLTQQPSKPTSDAATKVLKEVEPEVITADGTSAELVVHEDDVGVAHSESAVCRAAKRAIVRLTISRDLETMIDFRLKQVNQCLC